MSASRKSKYQDTAGQIQKKLDQLRTKYNRNNTAIHLLYVLGYRYIIDNIDKITALEMLIDGKRDMIQIEHSISLLEIAIDHMNSLYESKPEIDCNSEYHDSIFRRYPSRTYAEVMECVCKHVPDSTKKDEVVRYFRENLQGSNTKIGDIWELFLIVTALLQSGFNDHTNKPVLTLFNFSDGMVNLMQKVISHRDIFDFDTFVLILSATNHQFILKKIKTIGDHCGQFYITKSDLKALIDEDNYLCSLQRAYGEIVTDSCSNNVEPVVSAGTNQSQSLELPDDVNSNILLPELDSASLQRISMVSKRFSCLFSEPNPWRQRIIKIGIDEKNIRELEEIVELFEPKLALNYKQIALHLARLDFYLPTEHRYLLENKIYQLCALISCTNNPDFLQFVPRYMNLYAAILAGYSRSTNIIAALIQSNPGNVKSANQFILHDDCKLSLAPSKNNKQPSKNDRLVAFTKRRKNVPFDSPLDVNPYALIHRSVLNAIKDNDMGLLQALFKLYDLEKVIIKNIKSSAWFEELLLCAIKHKNIAALRYLIIDRNPKIYKNVAIGTRNDLGVLHHHLLFAAAATGDAKLVQECFSAAFIQMRHLHKDVYASAECSFEMVVSGAIESGNKDFLRQVIDKRAKLSPGNTNKIHVHASLLSVKLEVMQNLVVAIDSNEIKRNQDIVEYFIRYGDLNLFISILQRIPFPFETLIAAVRHSKDKFVDYLLANRSNQFDFSCDNHDLDHLVLLAKYSSNSGLAERVINHFYSQDLVLASAMRIGHLKMIEKMLNRGAKCSRADLKANDLIYNALASRDLELLNFIFCNLASKRLSDDFYPTHAEVLSYIIYAIHSSQFEALRILIEMRDQFGQYYPKPSLDIEGLGSDVLIMTEPLSISLRDPHGRPLFHVDADNDTIARLKAAHPSLRRTTFNSLITCEAYLRRLLDSCHSTDDFINMRSALHKAYKMSPVYLIQSLERIFADPKRYGVSEERVNGLRLLVIALLNDRNHTKGDLLLISKLVPDLRHPLVQTITSTPSMKH